MRFVFWQVLDCLGVDFPSSWSHLYTALADPAFPASATSVAKRVVERWKNYTTLAWDAFPKVLVGQLSQRELEGFCVYGYCSAVHRVLHTVQDSTLLKEFGRCASWGDAWWAWNFLSESRWARMMTPVDLLHIHTDLKQMWLGSLATNPPRHRDMQSSSLLKDLTTEEHFSKHEKECLKRRDEPSTDLYLPSYAVQLQGALSAFKRFRARSLDRQVPSKIVLSAFGVHFTTLLEPITALRQLLPAELIMAAIFYGSSHPPPEPIVQEVCPASSENERQGNLLCFLHQSPAVEFWQKIVDWPSLSKASERLSAVFATDESIRNSDCIICGGGQSPTLCFLMRMVTRAPMLFTLQAPLSFRMPSSEDQRALLVALFREMASDTLASTSSVFLQRQVWVQTGCLLPVVRNHNWYAANVPGRWGDDRGEQTPKEILFWQNHVALKSDCSMVVWRFMKQVVQSDFPFNLVFKNVRHLPGASPGRKVYSLRNEESSMLSFSKIRQRYLGAVLFPHDLGMFSFDDLYALGVPIFLPADSLIATIAFAQLISTKNYPWYLLREEHANLKFNHANAPMPWDPGWDGRDSMSDEGKATWLGSDALGVERLLESMTVSNFKLYPHIRRFRSLTTLLHAIGCSSAQDLLATGEAMRSSAAEAWKITAAYYRFAIAKFMDLEFA